MKSFLLLFLLCFNLKSFSQNKLYQETWRPQFHYSTPLHWINDPNGLVYFDGEYHLFAQHNPMANYWGHMSWAHAVSKDLVHWEHLPLAIEEGKEVMIFSGSCVIDSFNTSGFGKEGKIPMVAVYTGHTEGVNQSQHLAYSLDHGRSWTKYDKNPVLDLKKRDFRDPKVFWHAPQRKWVMAVMLPIEKQVQFYSSGNLKDWKLMSHFGPAGDTTGIWECPDLFQVPIVGEPGKKKWVFMHSPAPYMQYFVGEFDGTTFKNENDPSKIFRPDYGPDYYAAIVYNNLPAGSTPVSIGWANNWNYANALPTSPWKSVMSISRELSVKKINGQWQLIQSPVAALSSLKGLEQEMKNISVEGEKLINFSSQQMGIELVFEKGTGSSFGIQLAAGNGHPIEIGYESSTNKIYIDRSKTANQSFNERFVALNRFETILPSSSKELKLKVFFDQSIVEVFVNDGEAVLTAQLFPDKDDNRIQLFSKGGKTLCKELHVWQMKSIW
jgi:fructan beta-fructosidase